MLPRIILCSAYRHPLISSQCSILAKKKEEAEHQKKAKEAEEQL